MGTNLLRTSSIIVLSVLVAASCVALFDNDSESADGADYKSLTISSKDQWTEFTNNVNNGMDYSGYRVDLAVDIDFSDTLITSVGGFGPGTSCPFSGIFYGNGHTISNVTVISAKLTNSNGEKVSSVTYGLFGYVKGGSTPAEIHDLLVSGITISGTNYIGTIAGYADNAVIQNCASDSRCTINMTSSDSDYKGDYVGGLIGYGSDVTIKTCRNSSPVVANIDAADGDVCAGGVIGHISKKGTAASSIIDTDNCGNITLISSYEYASYYVGGIVALAYDTALDHLANSGSISMEAATLGDTGDNHRCKIGGIAGMINLSAGSDHAAIKATSLTNNGDIDIYCRNICNIAMSVGGVFGANGYSDWGYTEVDGVTYRSMPVGFGIISDTLVENGNISVVVDNSSRNKNNDMSVYVGGVTGYYSSQLTNAESNGTIYVEGTMMSQPFAVGGVLGGMIGVDGDCLKKAVNNSAITVNMNFRQPDSYFISYILRVGGIIGYTDSGVMVEDNLSVPMTTYVKNKDISSDYRDSLIKVSDCVNHADINVKATNIYRIDVALLIGRATAAVEDCSSYGNVEMNLGGEPNYGNTGATVNYAGLIGSGDLIALKSSSNYGNVSLLTDENTSKSSLHLSSLVSNINLSYKGLFGYVDNCYATGTVNFTADGFTVAAPFGNNKTNNSWFGGLFGYLQGVDGAELIIENCISDVNLCNTVGSIYKGKILGIGGVSGCMQGQMQVKECSYHGSISVIVQDTTEQEKKGNLYVAGLFAFVRDTLTGMSMESCHAISKIMVGTSDGFDSEPSKGVTVTSGAVHSVVTTKSGNTAAQYFDVYGILGEKILYYSGTEYDMSVDATADATVADSVYSLIEALNKVRSAGSGTFTVSCSGGTDLDHPALVKDSGVASKKIYYTGENPSDAPSRYLIVDGNVIPCLLPVLTKESSGSTVYTFTGWSYDGSGKTILAITADMGDVTLTPVWSENSLHTVTIETKNGMCPVASLKASYVDLFGDTIYYGEHAIKVTGTENYVFDRWTVGGTEVYGRIYLTEDITFSAVFIQAYTVTINATSNNPDDVISEVIMVESTIKNLAPGTIIYTTGNEIQYGNNVTKVTFLDNVHEIGYWEIDGVRTDLSNGYTVTKDFTLTIKIVYLNQKNKFTVSLDGDVKIDEEYDYSPTSNLEYTVELPTGHYVLSMMCNNSAISTENAEVDSIGIKLTYPRNLATDFVIVIESTDSFDGHTYDADIENYTVESGVLYISGNGMMKEYNNTDNKAPWINESVNRVVISSGITGVGGYAFYRMSSINYVELGDTLLYIGENAFSGTSLKYADFPATLSYVDEHAFLLIDFYYDDHMTVDFVNKWGTYHGNTGSSLDYISDHMSVTIVEGEKYNVVEPTYSDNGSYDVPITCSVCGQLLGTKHIITDKLASTPYVLVGDTYKFVSEDGSKIIISSSDVAAVKNHLENSGGAGEIVISVPQANITITAETIWRLSGSDILLHINRADASEYQNLSDGSVVYVSTGSQETAWSNGVTMTMEYNGSPGHIKVCSIDSEGNLGKTFECTYDNGYVSFTPTDFGAYAIVNTPEETDLFSNMYFIAAIVVAVVIAAAAGIYIYRYEKNEVD